MVGLVLVSARPAAQARGREHTGGVCSFAEHEQKLRGLKAEAEALKEELNHAIKEKRKAHLPSQVHQATEAIRTLQASWVAKADEVRDLEYHIRFKHPDRGVEFIEVKDGDETKKRPRRYDITSSQKSSEQSQVQRLGLEARLDRLKEQVVAVYSPLVDQGETRIGPKPDGNLIRLPASAEVEGDEPAFERIRLTIPAAP
jgi:hypothetical protein